MRKYRIKVEHEESRDGKSVTTRFYPQYRKLWLGLIPRWYPTSTSYYNAPRTYWTLDAAMEDIKDNLRIWNNEGVKTNTKYYKVCIQESKESIELC